MEKIQEAIQNVNSTEEPDDDDDVRRSFVPLHVDDSDDDDDDVCNEVDFDLEEREEFLPTNRPKLSSSSSRTLLKEQMKFKEWSKEGFEKAIEQMDKDQKRIFDLIEDQCMKIGDKERFPAGPPAIHIFCSGSAGYVNYCYELPNI